MKEEALDRLSPFYDELMINKRKTNCFPNKLRKYKRPLVNIKDFPSRVSLLKEEDSAVLRDRSEERDFSPKASDSPSKKSPIAFWRRADYYDVEAVTKLIEKSNYIMNDLFGEPDVPNLIEKSAFAMVQFNSNMHMVSFTSAFSYPDIPAVPAFEWYTWLDNAYKLKDVTPRNCIFIHYMAWESDYYRDFLKLTLETMFLECMFLSNIVITKPPRVRIPSIIPEYFVQVLPDDAKLYDCDCNSLQTVMICLRHSLMERLKIRLAMVEDHDDLMPIVEQQTQRLRELYGDFCMAEIIEFPGTKDRKTLVCESMGYAVGFMTLNRAVDFELLNSQFDLAVFHGLRKPNDKDTTTDAFSDEFKEDPLFLPDKIEPYLDIINSEQMLTFLNWKPSLCASAEDLEEDTDSSVRELNSGYNILRESMSELLRETLNLHLAPKFSAHALSVTASNEENISTENTTFEPATQPGTAEASLNEETPAQSETSLISLQYYNLPTYNGEPNAFCIELFAMDQNFDDRLCNDFIEAAFELFPDLEYCLLTIPSQSPALPLLDFFTRVTPRPLRRFKQELYVCHKSSIVVTFMRVRRICKSDLNEIYALLQGIKNNEFMYADIASSCFYEDSAYQGFVLICSKAIVGVAVLCNEYDMEYLAQHYHVADLIDFDLHKIDYHAIVKHLVLSPIYQPHARFFLRDIMRMADVTSLYRTRYEEVESNWNKSSLLTVLGQFIPVKPRRMVKYHAPSLGVNVPPAYFLRKDIPFSLYHINSRVCSMKKFTSNIKVVVVGASKTAFSFLENLLFAPSSAYVSYTNITLVSPHGMGTELPSHPARDLMFPLKGKYNRFYKIQMCLKTYVNFVYGVMTHINRVDKYIMVNGNAILSYDYLILLCGRQFLMPVPVVYTEEKQKCHRYHRLRCSLFKYLITQKPKEHTTNLVYPPNVFLVNTEVDATNALISLQYLIQKRKGFREDEKIIIYGHNISTYMCTQALLKFGIPARYLAVVEPFPLGKRGVSCFRDEKIDEAVLKTLKKLGIDHYKSYILHDWTLCENNQIQTAIFHSMYRKVTLKCLAMFPFERKLVSEVTFKAVNEASLVYDGKLVINSAFQTNDSNIYAAGGLTKYQRKYYARDKQHRNFSASEIGKHLAEVIRKKIDPTEEDFDSKTPEVIRACTQPLTLFAVLPGGWNYFSLRKPGKFDDPETRSNIKEIGDVLITGDCEMSNGFGYFKLELDDCGFVTGLLCYTADKIDVENLEMLFGKSEKLLNDLLLRFDLGLINDFYSYFREPWVYAIFHDRFKFVLDRNNELFYEEKPPAWKQRIIDLVINALKESNWQRPSEEKLEEIMEKFQESDLKEQITDNILEYLYYFDEPFPMYATPRILRVLLHDASTSFLHKNTAGDDINTNKPAIRISEMVRRV